MKKLIRIPLILILVCCLSFSFSAVGALAATNEITLTTSFDIEKSVLNISGVVDSEKGNIPMTMTFKSGDELVTADQTVTNSSVDGKIKFAFDGIPFNQSSESGTYEITVTAAYIGAVKTEEYNYIGIKDRFTLIEDINSAVYDNDKNTLISILDENKNAVTGGEDALFSASSAAKTVFAKHFIAKGEYEIPGGYEEKEDIDAITQAIGAISENYKEALCYAVAADVSSQAELEAWVEKYAGDRGLFEDDPETGYNEADLTQYFDTAKGNKGLYDRINKAGESAKDFAELKDEVLKAGVLEALEAAKPAGIQEITEKNTSLLPVNIKNFNKLKDTYKKSACDDLTDCTFSSVEDYAKQFDETVDYYLDKQNEKSGGTGGGGGSSSGSSSSKGSYTTTQTSKPIDMKNAEISTTTSGGFGDLENCEWAKEAVGYLSSKGVVSGKAAGVFDPFTPVTRAEFTKMVVLAFGINTESYEDNFSDVSVSDWFAPYVASAYKSGVVNGMGDGTFAPGALITRQDMAVLLYRAKGMTPLPEEKDVYYDSENISDYAKSAVFALYFNGIALGYGDGTFGPLNNATRAEAAQMIYKMVTFDK